MNPKLNVVIAVRQLHGESRRPKVVTVKLGKPRKSKEIDWECPFSITGLGIRGIQHGRGVDAIQALYMALEGVRVQLERSGVRLSWSGGRAGDAGFYRFVPKFFGPKFSKRLDQIIDREVERFGRAIRRKHRRIPKSPNE